MAADARFSMLDPDRLDNGILPGWRIVCGCLAFYLSALLSINDGSGCELERIGGLVFAFEKPLNHHGLTIKTGSELERACCCVLEVLGKHEHKSIRNPQEDVRVVLTEVTRNASMFPL